MADASCKLSPARHSDGPALYRRSQPREKRNACTIRGVVLEPAPNGAIIDARDTMRSTIALDDDLIRTAQEYTGVMEKSALMREALKALIEREAARRLAGLGGASPGMAYIPRRRAKAK